MIPRLRRLRGPAKVEVRAQVRNVTRENRDVTLAFTVGRERYVFDPERAEARRARGEITNSFTIDRPRLWQPGRPALYDLTVGGGDRRRAQRRRTG